MRKQTYSVAVGRRNDHVHSRPISWSRQGDVDVQAGKTGFISKAGYCLATLLRLPQGGPQVAVVVLGAKSNAGRFWETRHLFNWLSARPGAARRHRRVDGRRVSPHSPRIENPTGTSR